MKKGKRTLALVLTLVVALAMLPSAAFAADYTGHWAQGSIRKAVDMGWFSDSNNTRPNATITRAEFVTMVNRMKGYSGSADLSAFSDVKPTDWYYGAFSTAMAAGYLTGNNGKLNPNANITRNEAVAIFARISGLDTTDGFSGALANVRDAGGIPEWAKPYAGAAIANGLIAGSDGNFNGNSNITRAETAVLLERLFYNIRTYNFGGTYTGSASSVIVSGAGVTLKDMNISGDLTIAKSVGEGEVTLKNVKVGGMLDVQGGGMNSVYLENCEIKSITVTKDNVRVVFADGTTADYAYVAGADSAIVVGNGATVGSIVVESDAEGASIVVESGAKVTSVEVDASGTSVALASGVTVGTLTVAGADSSIELSNGASVTTLTVASTAKDTTIETANGSKIGTMTINADGTEVSGGGNISTANIKASDVVIEQKPSTTNVDSGVKAEVGGSTVTGGTTSGGGGGGGGGSSSGGSKASYTVTFDANGGTVSEASRKVTAGSAIGTLPIPTQAGYDFIGWFTAATGGTQYTATSVINSAVTLWAQWTASVSTSGKINNITKVTDGVAAVPETLGTWELQITTAFANGEKVTIAGTEYTCVTDSATGNQFDEGTAIAQATQLSGLLNTALTANFTVASGGTDTITFTEKAGKGGTLSAPVAQVTTGTGRIGSVTKGVTGVTEVTAVKGTWELEITGAFSVGDTVTVNGTAYTCVASGATGRQFNVEAGDAGDQAASLAAALDSALTGTFDVAAAGSIITFTQTVGGVGAAPTASVSLLSAGTAAVGGVTTTQAGVAAIPQTLGVYTARITANLAVGEKITIAGKTLTAVADTPVAGTSFVPEVSIDDTVTNIVAALQSNMPTGYTVAAGAAGSEDTLVLTQTTGSATAPTVTVQAATGSVTAGNVTQVTAPEAGNGGGTKQVYTLTVSSPATADGTISVTFIAGIIADTVSVNVTNGQTAAQIAAAILGTAWDTDVTDAWVMANPGSGATVTFTAVAAAANNANVSATLFGGETGVIASGSTTTQGAVADYAIHTITAKQAEAAGTFTISGMNEEVEVTVAKDLAANDVATAIRSALTDNTAIGDADDGAYTIGGSGAEVTLRNKTAGADSNTFTIAEKATGVGSISQEVDTEGKDAENGTKDTFTITLSDFTAETVASDSEYELTFTGGSFDPVTVTVDTTNGASLTTLGAAIVSAANSATSSGEIGDKYTAAAGTESGGSLVITFTENAAVSACAGNVVNSASGDVTQGTSGELVVTTLFGDGVTGVAATSAEAAVYTLTAEAATNAGTIKVTGMSQNVAVVVGEGDDDEAVAGKIESALKGNGTINTAYDIDATGAVVTLTAKTEGANTDSFSVAEWPTGAYNSPVAITPGTSAGANQVYTFTVSNGANENGTITVAFTTGAGGINETMSVNVSENDTPTAIATAIAGAGWTAAVTTAWTVANPSAGKVTFTAKAQAANNANVAVTFNNGGTGVTGSGSTTTEGVAAVDDTLGVYTYQITANFAIGEKITLGDAELEAVADTPVAGTSFVPGVDIATSVENIVAALAGNMPTDYTVAVDGITPTKLVLTQTTYAAGGPTCSVEQLTPAGAVAAVGTTTGGAAAVPETLGVYTVAVTANFVAGDSITIAGKTLTAVSSGAVVGTSFVPGASADATVTAIVAALAGNMPTGYNVTKDTASATLKLTQTAGNGSPTEPVVSVTQKSASSGAIGSVTPVTPGVLAVTPVKGTWTLSITTPFAAGDKISIDLVEYECVTDSADPASNEFNVGTAAAQAAELAAMADDDLQAAFDVTSASAVITFTEATGQEGLRDAPIALLVSGTGAIGAVTAVTPGVAAVAAVKGVWRFGINTLLVAGDIITVNGTDYTFGTTADFDSGTTIAAQADELAALLDTALAAFDVAASNGTITFTQTVGGTGAAPTVDFTPVTPAP